MADPVPIDASYRRQVDLLLRALPHVTAEPCFALKGGTAINLFVRDMPRLSVDLDLTYLPLEPREASLRGIGDALGRILAAAERELPGVRVTRQGGAKLVVNEAGTVVKVKVDTVLRGALLSVQELDLCDARFILDRIDGKPHNDLRLGFLLMLLSHDRPPRVVGRGARPARAGPVRRVRPPVRRHGPRAVRPERPSPRVCRPAGDVADDPAADAPRRAARRNWNRPKAVRHVPWESGTAEAINLLQIRPTAAGPLHRLLGGKTWI